MRKIYRTYLHQKIELTVHKCNLSMWQIFREHHYLNTECLGAGIRSYVAMLGEKPIGFIAVAHMLTRYFRVSRLVVLHDYQGIGIGKRLMNFVAELYTSQLPEIPFYLVTSNPQLVRGNLDHWRVRRVGHGSAGRNDSRINREIRSSNSKCRLSVSLQYIPKHKTSEA